MSFQLLYARLTWNVKKIPTIFKDLVTIPKFSHINSVNINDFEWMEHARKTMWNCTFVLNMAVKIEYYLIVWYTKCIYLQSTPDTLGSKNKNYIISDIIYAKGLQYNITKLFIPNLKILRRTLLKVNGINTFFRYPLQSFYVDRTW